MVSNDLISVLFAVSAQHISPASDVVVLIDVVARRAPSERAARFCRYLKYSVVFVSPDRLFFLRVTVQFEAACSPRTPLVLLYVRLKAERDGPLRPISSLQRRTLVWSGPVRSGPVPLAHLPTGLSFTLLCTGIYM